MTSIRLECLEFEVNPEFDFEFEDQQEENKVYDKDGEVSLDTFIEQFIMGAVVELDQQQ